MIQTVLSIQSHVYPFEDKVANPRRVLVQDQQVFKNLVELGQKKRQMQIKTKLIQSPYLIKLIKIYQEDLKLYYVYDYVPYSISKYISKQIKKNKNQINQMTHKLFLKKMTHQLTLLISFLARMKIQVDVCISNLGFTQDQKLKLFMNSKCRMGHKTELNLIKFYTQCKQKVLSYVESQFNCLLNQQKQSSFKIKGNKFNTFQKCGFVENSIQSTPLVNEQSYVESDTINDITFTTQNSNPSKKSTLFSQYNNRIRTDNGNSKRSSNLRLSELPFTKHRQSFNLSENKNKNAFMKPKQHKFSCNYGNNNFKNSQQDTSYIHNDKDQTNSFTHSKSIRIEFEKNLDEKKERKNSYKMKIISLHQYQMDDCSPKDVFNFTEANNNNEEDIFQFFAKKARQEEQQSRQSRQSRQQFDQQFDKFSDNHTGFQTPKQYLNIKKKTSNCSQTLALQQKVRIAKEKTSNLINNLKKRKSSQSYL